MLVKSVVLLFSLTCWIGDLSAQKKQIPQAIMPKGTWVLRSNPTGLIDPIEPNISVGTEYRFKDDWSIAVDVAYIFHANFMQNPQSVKGFIVRPTVRKYFGRQSDHYFEGEFHYKYLTAAQEDWVGRDVVNGIPSYEEYKKFRSIKQVAGLQFKAGIQESLVPKKWLWIEFYAGIGIRGRWLGTNLPHDAAYSLRRRILNQEFDRKIYFFPAFPLGARLLFKIK